MATRTANFKFTLVDFDKIPWSDDEHNNWKLADAVLAKFISISNIQGVWENATAVTIGQRYVDPDLGTIWTVAVAHTTASSGSFLEDRTANTTYWAPYTTELRTRGAWTTTTFYNVNDFVVSANIYAVCLTAHTSGATFAGDAVKWAYLIDATATVAATADDAVATAADRVAVAADKATVAADKATVNTDKGIVAADKATVAADKATVAADKATVAADKATVIADLALTNADVVTTNNNVVLTNADVVTTAANAAKLSGTSTTSLAIGTGPKAFTTQSGKDFNVGSFVEITSDAVPATDYMYGQVTAYSGTGLTVNVTVTGGSGTHADWTILGRTGPRGATGETGPVDVTFKTIAVSGQSDVVADSATDTLTLAAGSSDVVLTTDAGTDTVTVSLAANVAKLATAQSFSKTQSVAPVTLTSSSASVAVDASLSNEFSHTFTENTTLANPTNLVAGTKLTFYLTQHASSPKTLAYGSYFDFQGGTAPTVTATNSARDTLFCTVRSTTQIECVLLKGWS